LLGGPEESHEKAVEIASVTAKLVTEHLPNMSLKRYL
jgi:hypothetical protein